MDGPAVVVVDDEPSILESLCDLLEFAGFRVLCLADPDQVAALSPAAHPSVFLIDVMLPGTSGVELARSLRANGFTQTPMVAMSASERMLQMADSSRLFQETISKPFDLDLVLQVVERYAG
jgi:CheY-like chemotaxis protein